jgi:[acyl-carrier-protein] S-malonyltransferase
MEVVLLFPGQGSQKPGMGGDLAQAHASARDAFGVVDAALGEPLSALCFGGAADTLTLTHNAQPALLAHGIAAWETVRDRLEPFVRAAAGHSLGEFTAWCAAGAFTLPDAARLVRRRGQLMYEAGLARPGAMAAILGDLAPPIDTLCETASAEPEGGLVVAANYNAPDQVVISGEVAGVERAMALAKEAGAKRAIRLPVSGAFHSPLMAPARAGLAAALRDTPMQRAGVPVHANVNAEPVCEPADGKRLLEEQLTSPVRWTDVVRRLVREFPSALFVEMGPGSVLSGLVRRIAPGTETATCGTAADVDALLARVPS